MNEWYTPKEDENYKNYYALYGSNPYYYGAYIPKVYNGKISISFTGTIHGGSNSINYQPLFAQLLIGFDKNYEIVLDTNVCNQRKQCHIRACDYRYASNDDSKCNEFYNTKVNVCISALGENLEYPYYNIPESDNYECVELPVSWRLKTWGANGNRIEDYGIAHSTQ